MIGSLGKVQEWAFSLRMENMQKRNQVEAFPGDRILRGGRARAAKHQNGNMVRLMSSNLGTYARGSFLMDCGGRCGFAYRPLENPPEGGWSWRVGDRVEA